MLTPGGAFTTWSMVLIETLWNVNKAVQGFRNTHYFVLIETLWNVNTVPAVDKTLSFSVLIETLWNVNLEYPRITCASVPY